MPETCGARVLDDHSIRSSLLKKLASLHSQEVGTFLLEELGFCRGRVKADLAVVNGHIHAYEIKSDLDSVRRLTAQVEVYSKVADKATLVTGPRLCAKAMKLVPSWWGVLIADGSTGQVVFRTLRRSRKNPYREARALVELLWLDQALQMLEERNAARGFRRKPRQQVWDKICETFSVEEISAAVRQHLKLRPKSRQLSQH